jgi:hypothetical protein
MGVALTMTNNINNAHFRIRDRATLESIIFPIFNKYSLLTTKQFNYIKFKKYHNILCL